jgi:hypothetical protein
MKVLAALLLSLSLYGPQAVPKLPAPSVYPQKQAARNGGRWYLAQTGHAVYCYGPVRLVQQPDGGLQRVATFCQGDKLIVPLKD